MPETAVVDRPPAAEAATTVNASALALHLDCSRTYISKLEAEGVTRQQRDGFDLDAARVAYLRGARGVVILRSGAASSGSYLRCAPRPPPSVSRWPTITASRRWSDDVDWPKTDVMSASGGRSFGLLTTLIEGYAYPVSSSPDHSARYLQLVFRYDQRERGRNSRAQIGKLQSGTRDREITNNAGGLVATIFDLRRLRNAIAGRNPGFDHWRSLPVHSIFVGRLIDPQQSCSTIKPN